MFTYLLPLPSPANETARLHFSVDEHLLGVDKTITTSSDNEYYDEPLRPTLMLSEDWVPKRALRRVWEQRWPALRYAVMESRLFRHRIVDNNDGGLLDQWSGDVVWDKQRQAWV